LGAGPMSCILILFSQKVCHGG